MTGMRLALFASLGVFGFGLAWFLFVDRLTVTITRWQIRREHRKAANDWLQMEAAIQRARDREQREWREGW